ncbi:hypothetical protein ABZ589_36245 [Streptomyces sp. NPDC013313]|uniref:hypothetical protein n=1 Tax=Streptomyces sp. NPDC013313 TaxID=3155603 RepID=UPI0033FEA985
MPHQHAATTLTAAAVIAAILFARAAVLYRTGRSHGAPFFRPPRRVTKPGSGTRRLAAVPSDEVASYAVREAEQHVHRCWQQLRPHTDPSE